MSFFTQDTPVVPRDGVTLVVGIVARISGCQDQKELSLEDQEDHGKEVVTELYSGPVDYRVIATKGKGEALDRPELEQIKRELCTSQLDLLVIEDLGRLIRGGEATRFLGMAVDHGTRVISPNDCIDTSDPNWEQDALEACAEHVSHNVRTSKRIKQKTMNRFIKYGFTPKRNIFGYTVPEGAKSFGEWLKDDGATAIIQEGANRLRASLNCTAVADWFNSQKIPVGPYCRRPIWDGVMVNRFYKNRLLSGRPSRGTKHTVKIHETGRRKSVKNPLGPKFLNYPPLAHLDPVFQDELIIALAEKNAHYKRAANQTQDPRFRVPWKRTRFPGQHACCWYCGRQCVWGGNGMTNNLMCNGAREWKCWNSFGFNGGLAATRLVDIITTELYKLEGFDTQYAELVQLAMRGDSQGLSARWEALRRDEATLHRERENFSASIKAYGPRPMLMEMLDELETRTGKLEQERRQLERLGQQKLIIPESTSELRDLLQQEFKRLAIDSPEFGDLLRLLVPEFHVYLVRLCDGGKILPRARVKLNLAGSITDAEQVPGLQDKLSRIVTIDLFDPPTQREAIREEAVRLAAHGLTHRQIAAWLPGPPTTTAVTNALALDRQMKALGLTSPYVTVFEPPTDFSKLRRHKNAKYQFQPLEGYLHPPL